MKEKGEDICLRAMNLESKHPDVCIHKSIKVIGDLISCLRPSLY